MNGQTPIRVDASGKPIAVDASGKPLAAPGGPSAVPVAADGRPVGAAPVAAPGVLGSIWQGIKDTNPVPMLQALYQESQTDPILGPVGKVLPSAALLGAFVKGLGKAQGEQFNKARDAVKAGRYDLAQAYTLAWLTPLVGPMVAGVAETAQNDPARAIGQTIGTIGQFGLPEAGAAALRGARAAVPRISAKPGMADAVRFAEENKLPIDVGGASRNDLIRRLQTIPDNATLGGFVEYLKQGPNADALELAAAELARKANPMGAVDLEGAGQRVRSTMAQGLGVEGATAADQIFEVGRNRYPAAVSPEAAGVTARDALVGVADDAGQQATKAYSELRSMVPKFEGDTSFGRAGLDPLVEAEVRRVLAELDSQQYSKTNVYDAAEEFVDPVTGEKQTAGGRFYQGGAYDESGGGFQDGNKVVVPGNANAPVFRDIVSDFSPPAGGAAGLRRAIREGLAGAKKRSNVWFDRAVEVAEMRLGLRENRLPHGGKTSKPTLPPDAGVYGPGGTLISQDMLDAVVAHFGEDAVVPMPATSQPGIVRLTDAKRAFRPLYDQLGRDVLDLKALPPNINPTAAQNATAQTYLVLKRLFDSPEQVSVSVADELLRDLKRYAAKADTADSMVASRSRSRAQRTAVEVIGKLESELDDALTGLDPGAPGLLAEGRAATKAKYEALELLKAIPETEPVGAYRALTSRGDAKIGFLRAIAQRSPETVQALGRAVFDEMFQGIAEANFSPASFKKAASRWLGLGPNTRELLAGSAADAARVTKLVETMDKTARSVGGLAEAGEGVQAFNRVTGSVRLLRRVTGFDPSVARELGRAWLEDRFLKAFGDRTRGLGLHREWTALPPAVKELLFPDPILRRDLNSLMLLTKRFSESINPSGSGLVGMVGASAAGNAAGLIANPYATMLAQLVSVPMVKALHSPTVVRMLIDGITVPQAGPTRAAAVAAGLPASAALPASVPRIGAVPLPIAAENRK